MNPTSTYTRILEDTTRILEDQKEIAILKGETFNLFSILKMESRENDTHSAFLGELLNPKGSHNFGNIFLKLFLKTIELEEHIDVEKASLYLEYYIGPRDDHAKTGGRVDILIKDDNNNTLCIENKLDAVDQNTQIARYCNFNQSRNKVYYLTSKDKGPESFSFCDKKLNEDFYIIKYKNEIIEWLEACSKEAADQPILRETIKQYIILLKKLTNQLSDVKMENKIKDLIISNYTAANTISNNIEAVELEYTELFLKEVEEKLNESLNIPHKEWTIEVSEKLGTAWSGIKIFHKNWLPETRIQLQGNSKIPWSDTGYGLVTHKSSAYRLDIESELKSNSLFDIDFESKEYWPFYKLILSFGNIKERAKLFNKEQRDDLVTFTADKLIEIANVCKKPLLELNK